MSTNDTGNRAARQQQILDELFRSGTVKVEDLCQALNVSPATIRRELAALESSGRLRRTHGGAEPVEPLLYEGFRHDSSFRAEIDRCSDEKRRIAMAAAAMIENDDTVIVNPGTTTTQVTRSIPQRSGVTIVTTTVNVAMELSKRTDLTVFVTGGFLRTGWFSLIGPATTNAILMVFPDKAIIGVNGIDAERGLTAFHPDEAALAQLMIRQSRHKIVVADHTKVGKIANYQICPVHEIDVIVTDTLATDEMIAPLLGKNVEVVRV